MKAIEPVYQEYREQGLVILAINVRQSEAAAAAFIDKLNISYDVLLDPQGETARDYGVVGLPTTFVLDRQGRLHTRILGESPPQVFTGIIGQLL
jgi:peroxiredoxin